MEPQMTEEQRKELEEKIKNMSPEELKEFQQQQCIFCQIIGGKVPSKKVYEDDKCLAVLDVNPAAIGHVLLLPKEHYAIMPQIPDEELGYLFSIAKHISQSMLRKLKVEGTNIFVANGLAAGQKAQHFMIHIIPRKDGDGVLNLPDHLVELEKREKAGELIGNRMNELMGIKKEKVLVQKKVDEFEEGKKGEKGKKEQTTEDAEEDQEPAETEIVDAEDDNAEKESGKKNKKETEKSEDEEEPEVEEPTADKEETEDGESDKDSEDDKKDDDTEDDEEKDSEDDKKETDGDSKEDENSDLDDIADLFK